MFTLVLFNTRTDNTVCCYRVKTEITVWCYQYKNKAYRVVLHSVKTKH